MKRATSAGIHTSSATDEWLTPPVIAERLDRLGVALDPCWHPRALYECALKIMAEDDGLAHDWVDLAAGGLVYVNPPYSNLGTWLMKCALSHVDGAEVLALVPARTETKGFQEHVFGVASACNALAKRVSFYCERPDGTVGPKTGSTFSTWLVYYGQRIEAIEAFADIGYWFPTKAE